METLIIDNLKPTIWIFSLEPIESRYTCEWHTTLPQLLLDNCNDYNVIQIDGIQNDTEVTPGAFLNFSDTNYWKSSQLCKFLEIYNKGIVKTTDKFLFTDAWNTSILQIKYMKDLLGYDWEIHGLWHAGSYDKWDGLGQRIKNKDWSYSTERAIYHSLDYNWFATVFHQGVFHNVLFENLEWLDRAYITGWPMEYMPDTLAPYKNISKENIILFPHRIAPEKQPDIFRDLSTALPEYKFIVCQDTKLTKKEYHELIAKSKVIFSSSLQETLGISPFEGAILGSMPILPDRLSYKELFRFDNEFLYPSEWTETFLDYQNHKEKLINKIRYAIINYESLSKDLETNIVPHLLNTYFSATNLINQLKRK